jgi:hypothetical protein
MQSTRLVRAVFGNASLHARHCRRRSAPPAASRTSEREHETTCAASTNATMRVMRPCQPMNSFAGMFKWLANLGFMLPFQIDALADRRSFLDCRCFGHVARLAWSIL